MAAAASSKAASVATRASEGEAPESMRAASAERAARRSDGDGGGGCDGDGGDAAAATGAGALIGGARARYLFCGDVDCGEGRTAQSVVCDTAAEHSSGSSSNNRRASGIVNVGPTCGCRGRSCFASAQFSRFSAGRKPKTWAKFQQKLKFPAFSGFITVI